MEPTIAPLRQYPDWKAPSEDGQIVIWPQPQHVLQQTISNRDRLTSARSVCLQNIPLSQVRRQMRAFIGINDDHLPVIATGHQVELHHSGVWVKNILINQIARKLKGQAFHFAIDTDGPKHLSLRWPGQTIPITDDPKATSAAWAAQVEPPSPAHLGMIQRQLDASAAGWDFRPMLPEVLASLRRLSLESLNLPSALANALHEMDWRLGLRHHVMLASPIWSCLPLLLFVHDLISQADPVASRYNAALDAYRSANGIRSNMRPMPDLFIGGDAVELPFWLDDLHTGKRTRPSVFRTDVGWLLKLVSGEEFEFDQKVDGWEAASRLQRWLSQTRHRLTPRAITNMIFLRLLLADQFVHGIGGGRYDQVTDHLIGAQYGIEPPAFAVTTATMYFPTARDQQRVCMPCVKQRGHRLKHSLLGARKRELAAQIAALPRGSAQRSARFFEMHRELSAAAAGSADLQRWEQEMHQTQQREREEQILFDRELFYALQPQARLAQMVEKYEKDFA